MKYRLKATANKSWAGYDAVKAGAGYLDVYAAVNGTTTQSANTGIAVSQVLAAGTNLVAWDSVSWNSVSWNSVSWNSEIGLTNIGDESVVSVASAWADRPGTTLSPAEMLHPAQEEIAPEENQESGTLDENNIVQRAYLPLITQQ